MNPKRKALLAWLDQQPEGASWTEIAAWHGPGSGAIHAVLNRLRISGLVGFVGGASRHGKWHATQHAQTAQAAYLRDKDVRDEEQKRRRIEYEQARWQLRADARKGDREAVGLGKRAKRLSPKELVAAAAMAWSERAPTHRVISAADAPPIPKRGPNSIWDVAT